MPDVEHRIALGVGVSGALADVSSYVRISDGITVTGDLTSEWNEVSPVELSFTLENADGRFTPENPTSPLDTPLAENARVCWEAGGTDGRLLEFTVRALAPAFPGDQAGWSRVRVTCDDVVGKLARVRRPSLAYATITGAGPYAFWPFDDQNAPARELYDAAPFAAGAAPEFGYTAPDAVGGQLARFTAPAGTSTTFAADDGRAYFGVDPYFLVDDPDSWMSFWIVPQNTTTSFEIGWDIVGSRFFRIRDGAFVLYNEFAATTTTLATIQPGTAYFISINLAGEIYINDELTYDDPNSVLSNTLAPYITIGDAAGGDSDVLFGMLAHTARRPRAALAATTTATNRAAALATLVPGVTFDLTGFTSEAPVGPQDGAMSALDRWNELLSSEQAELQIVTTGTLLSPTTVVRVRDATRRAGLAATFDVEGDLDGSPEFERSITEMLSEIIVDGTEHQVRVDSTGRYTHAQLTARVDEATDDASVIHSAKADVTAWGEDRLNRGANIALRVSSFTIDLRHAAGADIVATLLRLQRGDRIRLDGLSETQLGFTTWDGWWLGREETHTVDSSAVTVYVAAVLPAEARYDIDRVADDGELSLDGAINSSVTAIAVQSSDTACLLTTDADDMPFTIQIDNEQLRVTAVTSATPQIATVVRGVNGTTAATHADNAAVTIAFTDPGDLVIPSDYLVPSDDLYPVDPGVREPIWAF